MSGATGAVAVASMGAATSAYGQLRAGAETKKLYDRNAKIAEMQATDATNRGAIDEKKARQLTEQVIGSQRVSLAAQGVDINRGSALDIQANAAYLGELDALTIRNNAVKEAWGYRVQAQDLTTKGGMAKQQSQFGAFNTILGTGSSLLLAKYGGTTKAPSVPAKE